MKKIFNYNFLLLVLIILSFLYLNNKNNIEKMTNIPQFNIDIDSIKNLSEIADKLQKGGLTIPGNLTVTGSFNLLPRGSIIAYNGTTAPSGWAICNGQKIDGYQTPDLRGRFIYGYNNSRFGETGGSKDAIVVSHNHGGATSEDGDHYHPYDDVYNIENKSDLHQSSHFGMQGADTDNEWFLTLRRNTLHSSIGHHSHTISSDGESGTDKNLPPYVILLYIIKL